MAGAERTGTGASGRKRSPSGPVASRGSGGELLQTVGRALQVLDAVASRDHWGVTQLARALGMNKTVLIRILATLSHYGFVDHSQPDGMYRAGERLWTLAARTARASDLRTAARPYLNRLVEKCGETAVLTVARNGQCVYVDAVPSPHPLRVVPELGGTQPLHVGAPARVLLAYLPEPEIRLYLETHAAEIRASGTDLEELWLELARIEREGYVLSLGEYEPGAFSLGVPLLDRAGRLIGAVAVAGPRTRWDEARTRPLLAELRATARDIVFVLQETDPLDPGSREEPLSSTST